MGLHFLLLNCFISGLSNNNKASLLDSIQSSPLNTSSYQDYEVVVEIMNKLKTT